MAKQQRITQRVNRVTVQKTATGFETITGTFTKVHLKIKAQIRRIAALPAYGTHYIGATENLDERWSNYGDWEFKHVLYETSSLQIAKSAEEDLIRYASERYTTCNKDPRSRGLRAGASRYYVYILADNTCQLR